MSDPLGSFNGPGWGQTNETIQAVTTTAWGHGQWVPQQSLSGLTVQPYDRYWNHPHARVVEIEFPDGAQALMEYGQSLTYDEWKVTVGMTGTVTMRYQKDETTTQEAGMSDGKLYSGKGFMLVSDGHYGNCWFETFDEAQDAAVTLAAKQPVAIYEAVGVLRPKADVVAKFSKRGAELIAAAKSLPTGEEVAPE